MTSAVPLDTPDTRGLINAQAERVARHLAQDTIAWGHIAVAAMDPLCWDDGVAAVVDTMDAEPAELRDELLNSIRAQPFMSVSRTDVPAAGDWTAGEFLCAAARFEPRVGRILAAHGFEPEVATSAIAAQALPRQSCTAAATQVLVAAHRRASRNGDDRIGPIHVWCELTSPELEGAAAHGVLAILGLDVAPLHRLVHELLEPARAGSGRAVSAPVWDTELRGRLEAASTVARIDGRPIDTAELLMAAAPVQTELDRVLHKLGATPAQIASAYRNLRRGAVAAADRFVPTSPLGSRPALDTPLPVLPEVAWLVSLGALGGMARATIFRSDGTPLADGYAGRLYQLLWLWLVACAICCVYLAHTAAHWNFWPLVAVYAVTYRPSFIGFRIWVPLTVAACLTVPWPLAVVCSVNAVVSIMLLWVELQIRRNDSGNPNLRYTDIVQDAFGLFRAPSARARLASREWRKLIDG
ncbi:hypothetical protein ACIBCN_01770 [Nocardia sp. NPDC051052]|uniref:hypothetical protein n=1 Tax=Nocardia sp. NPDC051052 TaxID=3364322 RepID=UPI0037B797FD